MSKINAQLFENFRLSLPPEKAEALSDYFIAFDHHVFLPKKTKSFNAQGF